MNISYRIIIIYLSSFICTIYFTLFYFDVAISITFSCLLVLAYFYLALKNYRLKYIGLLHLLSLFVLCLPFIHLIPYIWFDFESRPVEMWGLDANEYMYSYDIISLVSSFAVVATVAWVLPIYILNYEIKQNNGLKPINTKSDIRTLNLTSWFALMFIGVYFSVLSAPSNTILESAYTHSSSVSRDINFSSLWFVSYAILTFVYVDSFLEKNLVVRKLKYMFVIGSLVYIIIFLQFLRGDRESLPWLLGLIIAFYKFTRTYRLGREKPTSKMIPILIFLLFSTSILVAIVRSVSAGATLSEMVSIVVNFFNAETFDFNSIAKGTWTAALLTPLSVAGDHVLGISNYNYGIDYLNILASVPPGFIADALDYVRPLGLGRGPAHEMRYGLGGTHITVLPFRSFGLIGIFFCISTLSLLCLRIEKKVSKKFSVYVLSLQVLYIAILPHFFWYGEKYFINFCIITGLVATVYAILNAPQHLRINQKKE